VRRPVAIFLGGSALLIAIVLRGVLAPSADRLPGIDSGNLYAWEVHTRAALGAGRLPFWNPYHFAGTPHLADPQTTVFYPPALLLKFLPVPAFLGWMIALHLWIAGAGTLFAARTIGLQWAAAAAAALAVMLGGSVPGWIHNGHLLLLYSAAWVPWAFGFAILSVRSGRMAPDGRLVAVLVLQFLSGYLQGTLYLAAALAMYFVFSAAWPDQSNARAPRWTPLAQLVLLAVLCGAAAAFQLLPTATLVAQAGRSTGLSYTNAVEGGWQPADLATLLYPFYGVVDVPPYRFLSDRLAYVGWILTAFAPFAFVARERRRMSVFLGLLAALACGLALGDAVGLFRLQHALFPGLRVPGRVLFLATFALALLGGLGLEAFLALARNRSWRRLAVPAVVSVLAVAAATYSLLAAPLPAIPPGPGWPWLPVALGVGVLMTAAAAFVRSPRVALAIALAAIVIDLTTLNAGAVATVPLETPADIRHSIGPPTGGRAISLCEHRVGAREFLLNDEPSLDGLPGLHLRGYGEWATLARSGEVPPGDGLYRRIGSDDASPARRDLLDMANVTRVISCREQEASGGETFDIRLAATAWPRAVWTCAAEELSRPELIARLLRGRYTAGGELRPRYYIKVRWPPAMDDARRAAVAGRHHLEDGVRLEGATWKYLLGDPSADAVVALMQDPEVEDTHGVDRKTGAILPIAELRDRVPPIPGDDKERQTLVGTAPCPAGGEVAMTAVDRVDGYVSARVNAPADGFVFLSEPYYSDRHAYVDGHRVSATRANLAFTAIAVPAGEHQVELRYVPVPFYLGSAISGMTGAGYAGVALIRRRRKIR
jgi:hypothetical protein